MGLGKKNEIVVLKWDRVTQSTLFHNFGYRFHNTENVPLVYCSVSQPWQVYDRWTSTPSMGTEVHPL